MIEMKCIIEDSQHILVRREIAKIDAYIQFKNQFSFQYFVSRD